jgi:hypothetical protein
MLTTSSGSWFSIRAGCLVLEQGRGIQLAI